MKNIIFSKYSNERAREFSIRTDILTDERGQRVVRKAASYEESRPHVEQIAKWYQRLEEQYADTMIAMNRARMTEEGVELEYLTGETLEEVLDGYLAKKQYDQLEQLLFMYIDEVKKTAGEEGFKMTERFRQLFGEVTLPEGLVSAPVTNIDMVLSNVILTPQENKKWTMIDYEWTFDCPIPMNYVIYRILHYYAYGSVKRAVYHTMDLFEKAGITQGEMDVYRQMEEHFQSVYVLGRSEGETGHFPIRFLYDDISPGAIDIREHSVIRQDARRKVQVFQSADGNVSEKDSVLMGAGRDGVFSAAIAVKDGTGFLRIDPCSEYCALEKLSLKWDNGEACEYAVNGIRMTDGSVIYNTDDPQILIPQIKGSVLHISFTAAYLDEAGAAKLYEMAKISQDLEHRLKESQQQLKEKKELIRDMENTKVWKLYRKYKHTVSKK